MPVAAPPPTGPSHLIRSHLTSVTALCFSDDNERIYSGDASGVVVVTSTRSLRPIASWNAHTDALLGVEEWGNRIITHSRDNKLHIWRRVVELPASQRVGTCTFPAAGLSTTLSKNDDTNNNLNPKPTLCYSMDVNALNFCRFSLLRLSVGHYVQVGTGSGEKEEGEENALVALPNLIDSEVADIWSLPSRERIHAAVGQAGKKSRNVFSTPVGERSTTGIIMSLHLYAEPPEVASSSSKASIDELRLLSAYESGGVTLRRYARTDKQMSVEGAGWEVLWNVKLHVESVMAMKVSRRNEIALTVSADHLIGRYDLSSKEPPEKSCAAHRTKHPGNLAIAIRDDGKVCAIAGWDGQIRLYATRTMKPLGTLKYHKISCQSVEFARSHGMERAGGSLLAENDDDSEDEESRDITRWLAVGGKDRRVSIWALIDFGAK